MKVLITGSTGLVGTSLVKQLRTRHQDFTLTLHTMGEQRAYRNDCYIIGDIRKIEDQDIFKNVDIVIHLAGSTWRERDPEKMHSVNVEGTRSVVSGFGKAKEKRSTQKRFIFISSVSVYGSARKKADVFHNEMEELLPTDIYGMAKRDAERTVIEMSRQYGIEYTILRAGSVICNDERSSLFRFIQLATKIHVLPLPTNNPWKTFIDLNDLCEIVELATVRQEFSGRIINACTQSVRLSKLYSYMHCIARLQFISLPVPTGIIALLQPQIVNGMRVSTASLEAIVEKRLMTIEQIIKCLF